MQLKKHNINEGVNLFTLQTDKFKSNCFTAYLLTPLKEETASLNSLLTDVLMAGCKKYPTLKEMNIKLTELYSASMNGYVQKRGEAQAICFNASFLDNKYAFDSTDLLCECLKLLGEVIFHPLTENGAFDASITSREKKNLCDSIEAQKNNKNTYAVTRCQEEMCADEDYSVTNAGKVEIVKGITGKALYEQYKKVLAESEIQLFYVGNASDETVVRYIQEYLPFEGRTPVKMHTEVITTAQSVKNITEKMDVSQGKLSLGFRTGATLNDDDILAFSLFNEVFGASPTSKLFMNVREKMSLCYYCSPRTDLHKGILVVASGINIEDKEKAQAAILEQLEDMKNGNISDEEIENGKKSIINYCKEIFDSASALTNWYASRAIVGKYSSPDDAIQAVRSCTKEDVIRKAKCLVLDTVYFLTSKEGAVNE